MDKLFLIAGPCAIEDRDTSFYIAEKVKAICDRLDIHYIFKGSYRKANRTRIDSFTGIGDEKALTILKEIGQHFQIDTITDIHESYEAEKVAQYVTHIQIPAFLSRQTELLLAAGRTGLPINLKKGQFLSPEAMKFALDKIYSTGNKNVFLCERGTSFGYSDLIVDATSLARMKRLGVPVVMDCTHAVQKPNQNTGITGGDAEMIEIMALTAAANRAEGLFIETHPEHPTRLKVMQPVCLNLIAWKVFWRRW